MAELKPTFESLAARFTGRFFKLGASELSQMKGSPTTALDTLLGYHPTVGVVVLDNDDELFEPD
jgi:hypothetical protein